MNSEVAEVKKFWVSKTNKGRRLGLSVELIERVNADRFEIREENGNIVLIPSEKGIELKLFRQRRWDGLPTHYYLNVPKPIRERIARLYKPYGVVENGKIVIKETTEEEELEMSFKKALYLFNSAIDHIHKLEEEAEWEKRKIGRVFLRTEFQLEHLHDYLLYVVAEELGEFYAEIDPAVV